MKIFFVWAEDIGEAISRAVSSAKKLGIRDPLVENVDYYDFASLHQDANPVVEGESYASKYTHYFPTRYYYKLPNGVVFALGEKEDDDEDKIRPSFKNWKDEDGLITIEAVVEADDLLEVYLELISVMSEIRAFWVKFHEDWESTGETIYVNEKLDSANRIETFLKKNKIDTLWNGYVILTTYFDEGATNLNISDHKTIEVLTYSKKTASKVVNVLRRRGLKRPRNFIRVSAGIHHWHYRHPNGRGREALADKLTEQGFRVWKNP